ncbi:MAG: hypothetical protein WCC64_15905 [Aliidongia sp.]
MVDTSKFNRYDISPSETVAFTRFLGHHTELNDLYWSFAPAYHFVRYSTKSLPPDAVTESELFLSGPDARRPPTTVKEWRNGIDEFANWARLGMILSAASYLEIYMREAIGLALMSDPFAIYGLQHQLDGIKLVKIGKKLRFDDEIQGCCKGTWKSRVECFSRLFGVVPAAMKENIKELENIRIMRNSVGHTFGRDIRSYRAGPTLGLRQRRVSEEKLKRWLSIINVVASGIDDYLGKHHIGSFEYLLIYHNNKEKMKRGALGKKDTQG